MNTRLLASPNLNTKLTRTDDRETRNRILQLSQKEAYELSISKNTIRYLRKHTKGENSFKIYSKVADRLKQVKI